MPAPKGNKYGALANRTRIVSDVLTRIAKQNPKRLRAACEAQFRAAENGDLAAFREISDRLEGKPAQIIHGAGAQGEWVVNIAASDANL